MKKRIILIGTLLLMGSIFVNADYKVYDNKQNFEKEKGDICEIATDGCNTFFMKDGKVAGGTEMFCKNHKVEWSCEKYKENVAITKTLKSESEEGKFCGGIAGILCGEGYECKYDGNYPDAGGTCQKQERKMSENDLSFYRTIRKDLDYKYQNIVFKAISKYLNKFENYSDIKKQKINNLLIKRLEKKISDFILQYPQDKALPKNANNKYLTLKLFSFELMKLDFEKGNVISWNQALQIAKSGNLKSIGQTHSLVVDIETKDGKEYVTREPNIDDFMKIKEVCGKKCDDIEMMTE